MTNRTIFNVPDADQADPRFSEDLNVPVLNVPIYNDGQQDRPTVQRNAEGVPILDPPTYTPCRKAKTVQNDPRKAVQNNYPTDNGVPILETPGDRR